MTVEGPEAHPVARAEGPDAAVAPAWWTFVGLLVAAVPLYVSRARAQWFYGDEWAFLAQRDGGSLDGLFAPHQEHWVTLPVIAYRVLWNLVGLHSYKPYLALALAAHLTVVVLLRAVLRRIGVGPWIATACAAVLLFYGSGSENIVWAFMITFTGGLAFGLAQLLLADHPGSSWRRDLGIFACGVAALMCSGIGLVMVGVVGSAVLVRRGLRPALRVTVPSMAAYALWSSTYGDAARAPTDRYRVIVRFAGDGLSTAVASATQHALVTVALGLVVGLGLVLVVWPPRRSWDEVRFDLAVPFASAVGAVGFYLAVGRSRVDLFGADYATRGRFIYVAVALLLPAVAVGADAVVRRWRPATLPVVLLLLAGVPGNIGAITVVRNRAIPPATVLAVASSPDLPAAPPRLRPWPNIYSLGPITAGWLRAGVADGHIPSSYQPTPDQQAEATALLALVVETPRAGLPADCPILRAEVRADVSARRPLIVSGVTSVQVLGPDGGRSAPREVGSFEPRRITTTGRTLTVLVRPDPSAYPETLCH